MGTGPQFKIHPKDRKSRNWILRSLDCWSSRLSTTLSFSLCHEDNHEDDMCFLNSPAHMLTAVQSTMFGITVKVKSVMYKDNYMRQKNNYCSFALVALII